MYVVIVHVHTVGVVMIKVFCVIYMCTTVIVRICLNIILVNVSAVVTDSVMIILKHLA